MRTQKENCTLARKSELSANKTASCYASGTARLSSLSLSHRPRACRGKDRTRENTVRAKCIAFNRSNKKGDILTRTISLTVGSEISLTAGLTSSRLKLLQSVNWSRESKIIKFN